MLLEEFQPAVYFTREDEELFQIHGQISKATTSDQAGTAFEGISISKRFLFVFFSCYRFVGGGHVTGSTCRVWGGGSGIFQCHAFIVGQSVSVLS